jgi:hypothetical protein
MDLKALAKLANELPRAMDGQEEVPEYHPWDQYLERTIKLRIRCGCNSIIAKYTKPNEENSDSLRCPICGAVYSKIADTMVWH